MSGQFGNEQSAIADLVQHFTRQCDKCKDGHLCPSCAKQYIAMLPLMRCGAPVGKVQWAIYAKHEERMVKEYDLSTKKYHAPSRLYQDWLTKYAAAFKGEVVAKGLSLMFVGSRSTGKTCAGTWLIKEAIRHKLSARFITFPALHRLNSASYHEPEAFQIMETLRKVDFLVVDELGAESNRSESVRQLADTYIKSREEALLPTVIISNTPFEVMLKSQMKGGYGASFAAMLGQRYKLFHFGNQGGDLRLLNRCEWFHD